MLRSVVQAKVAETALRARVARAQQAITALTVRRRGKLALETVEAVQQAAAALVAHHRVEGLLLVAVTEHIQERAVCAYAGRPAHVRQRRTLHAHELSATQAVLAYRQEDLIEHAFGRLKGRPLSLTPLYLDRDDHVTGLIRLLTIALRVLTTVEHTARRGLAQHIYAPVVVNTPHRVTVFTNVQSFIG